MATQMTLYVQNAVLIAKTAILLQLYAFYVIMVNSYSIILGNIYLIMIFKSLNSSSLCPIGTFGND